MNICMSRGTLVYTRPMQNKKIHYRLLHPTYWLTWLGFLLLFLLAQLPHRFLLGCGKQLGRLLYRLLPRRVHIAEKNISLCFPNLSPTEHKDLTRECFQNIGMGVFEAAQAWYAPKKRLLKLLHTQGNNHVQRALDAGCSVLLLSYHATNLELAAQAIAHHFPNQLVAYTQRNPVASYLLTKARSRFVNNVIASDNVRGILTALKKPTTLTYAFDHDLGERQSVFVTFFGHAAATVKATSHFAKGNVKVIPVAFYRDNKQHYQLSFDAPLDHFPGNDIMADTQRLNHVIEAHIRQHPAQYLWTHRRFKHQPHGMPYPYDS